MPTANSAQMADAMQRRKAVEDLLAAVQEGNLQTLKKALKDERFGTPDAIREVRDDYGRGVLHHAAHMGHTALCQHLIEKLGFDVNDQDKTGVYNVELCRVPCTSVYRPKQHSAEIVRRLCEGSSGLPSRCHLQLHSLALGFPLMSLLFASYVSCTDSKFHLPGGMQGKRLSHWPVQQTSRGRCN